MAAETFRTTKLEKFIQSRVQYMELQQKVIAQARKNGLADELNPIKYNQTATYNLVFELCQEFGIEMPDVLGVTPVTSGY